ncbi:MAG TPA: YihY/virulence factor BrkB family protein [Tepidisphaeraceae bacterium]|nr:YihY/virulence factor BrkB family protein [Tepidisphaeraceae bacterium]
MARLRDVPVVLKRTGPLRLAKCVIRQIQDDDIMTWGAAMAYSWLFAIFPFLVFLLSLVPLLPDQFKPDVKRLDTLLADTMPDSIRQIVMTQVEHIVENPSPGGFLSFGLILTVWASSGGMAMTMSALDKAYDVEKVRPYYTRRLLAILLTAVAATLIIAVLILLPVGTQVLEWLNNHNFIPLGFYWLVNITRYVLALLLMFTVLAMIYNVGTSAKQSFSAFSPGAVFSVTIWLALGALFRLYLTKLGGAANYNKTYGTVAGAAILLLFFYLDALVMLIGAEINSEIDNALCSKQATK